MKKDMTLLVMAAGMGSRFGGLKQIEPFGPNGEFLIDYSVYDAKEAGFNKIVFVIKKENYDIFKETIGARVEGKIKVEYVFQELTDIPVDIDVNDRTKPWGTGHAIRSARKVINEPFAVINADDFYGKDAYMEATKYFNERNSDDEWAIVAYQAKNTLTENGSVKRGICEVKDSVLVSIDESSVEEKNGKLSVKSLSGTPEYMVDLDTLVSMNFLCFSPNLFQILEEKLIEFLNNKNQDIKTAEFLIPEIINEEVKSKKRRVRILSTTSAWHGVTYKEDTDTVKTAISNMVEQGIYKNKLWD